MDNDQDRRHGDDADSTSEKARAETSGLGSSLSRPSFAPPSNSSPASDAGDLPLWLQSFGESANEPPRSDTPTPAASASPWAGGAQLRRETGFAASASDSSGSTSNFLSDDDLPEWLRSLSTSDTPSAEGTTLSAPDSGTMEMPSISRVWVADHDVPATTSGGMVFASIVQTIDTRPDSRLTSRSIEPEPSADSGRGGHGHAATQSASGGTVTMVEPTSDSGRSGDTSEARRRTRLILMAAIILVVLLLLFLMIR